MKKILASLLALTMAGAMSVPAFAATELTTSPSNNNGAGDYTIGVNGTYVAGANAAEKISVDIAWESMNFTYTAGDSTYSPENHKTTTTDGSWSTNTADITVTNHSNTAMSADFSFTATADGVKGVLTKKSVILENAEKEKYQTNKGTEEEPVYDAPKASTSFGIDPTSSAISATGSLGTVTVKLTKYDGFVYDATGVSQYVLENALTAAIQAGETKLTVLGNTGSIVYAAKNALGSAAAGTIDLTLYDVTAIDAYLFHLDDEGYNIAGDSLKTVTLPNATEIGNSAFSDCRYLTSVTAPKLTSVGTKAFYNNYKLTNISMPKCETVGNEAFVGCSALTSIELPEVITIGERAFNGCYRLSSISLPKCKTVGNSAFLSCSALTSIDLPKVTKVGNMAFFNCTVLNSVTFGTPVTDWGILVFGRENDDDDDRVKTENLTLTFAAGQKAFEGDNSNGWTATENDLNADTNVKFCGYTFKEIIISAPTT